MDLKSLLARAMTRVEKNLGQDAWRRAWVDELRGYHGRWIDDGDSDSAGWYVQRGDALRHPNGTHGTVVGWRHGRGQVRVRTTDGRLLEWHPEQLRFINRYHHRANRLTGGGLRPRAAHEADEAQAALQWHTADPHDAISQMLPEAATRFASADEQHILAEGQSGRRYEITYDGRGWHVTHIGPAHGPLPGSEYHHLTSDRQLRDLRSVPDAVLTRIAQNPEATSQLQSMVETERMRRINVMSERMQAAGPSRPVRPDETRDLLRRTGDQRIPGWNVAVGDAVRHADGPDSHGRERVGTVMGHRADTDRLRVRLNDGREAQWSPYSTRFRDEAHPRAGLGGRITPDDASRQVPPARGARAARAPREQTVMHEMPNIDLPDHRTFGADVEWSRSGDREDAARELQRRLNEPQALVPRVSSYSHTPTPWHKIVTDGTPGVRGEMVTPVMGGSPGTMFHYDNEAHSYRSVAGLPADRHIPGEDGMRHLQAVVETVPAIGGRSAASNSVHIHLGVQDIVAAADTGAIKRLVGMYAANQHLINELLPAGRRGSNWARPISAAALDSINASRTLRDLQYAQGTRYTAINLEHLVEGQQIEFRALGGTSDANLAKAWTHFLDAMVAYAKNGGQVERMADMPALLDRLRTAGLHEAAAQVLMERLGAHDAQEARRQRAAVSRLRSQYRPRLTETRNGEVRLRFYDRNGDWARNVSERAANAGILDERRQEAMSHPTVRRDQERPWAEPNIGPDPERGPLPPSRRRVPWWRR